MSANRQITVRHLGDDDKEQKNDHNRCSSFDNMHVFRFREFGLKTPIQAPEIGVSGDFTR